MYHTKANLGKRAVAALLDSVFLSALSSVVSGIVLYAMIAQSGFSSYHAAASLWGITNYVVTSVLGVALTVAYYVLMEGAYGATWGKQICKLVITDEQGNPITYGQSFLRYLSRVVSGLTFGIGTLIAFFRDDRKTLYDMMAKTDVREKTPSAAPAQATAGGQYAPPPPVTPPPVTPPYLGGNPQPCLIGVTGVFAGQSFFLPPQGMTIGRDPASCSVVYPQQAQGISRHHCNIQYNDATKLFTLCDAGSTYGTFLSNGMRVGQPTPLRPGGEFYLGDQNNLFRVSV